MAYSPRGSNNPSVQQRYPSRGIQRWTARAWPRIPRLRYDESTRCGTVSARPWRLANDENCDTFASTLSHASVWPMVTGHWHQRPP